MPANDNPDIINPFLDASNRVHIEDGSYIRNEVDLANRNSGLLLELLSCDITPIGAHYLLNHFDVPILDSSTHTLAFEGAFEAPYKITLDEIKSLPKITMPVTLECSGNGRAGVQPRSRSMPWLYEAVGTSEWTGTPLKPLLEQAGPLQDAMEICFTGEDRGFDKAIEHNFARSLTLKHLENLEALLVYEMNGQPLLPQHGAPLRLIVPGWYGMASVKWLSNITALTEAFDGYQQVGTYHYRNDHDDPGIPVEDIRVKSLMKPPGIPDWQTRQRLVEQGTVPLMGRAWSGGGRNITKVEVGIDDQWQEATLDSNQHDYAWVRWQHEWQAKPGRYTLRCRATDSEGNVQPLTPPWDTSGFGNNKCQEIIVFVR